MPKPYPSWHTISNPSTPGKETWTTGMSVFPSNATLNGTIRISSFDLDEHQTYPKHHDQAPSSLSSRGFHLSPGLSSPPPPARHGLLNRTSGHNTVSGSRGNRRGGGWTVNLHFDSSAYKSYIGLALGSPNVPKTDDPLRFVHNHHLTIPLPCFVRV